jgi:hypothetical protein
MCDFGELNLCSIDSELGNKGSKDVKYVREREVVKALKPQWDGS